jgi:putative nucleotidyltransferase with HDIG domain
MSTPTVIIADPCAMTQQCMSLLLRARKYRAHSASTIQETVELARTYQAHLILHSIDFTDGNAIDLLNKVRGTLPESQPNFFLLTDVVDQSRLLEIVEQGVMQVMIKRQFSVKVFYNKVDELLRRKFAEAAEPKAVARSESQSMRASPEPELKTPPAPSEEYVPVVVPEAKKILSRKEKQELYKSIKPVMSRAEAIERAEEVAELKALSPTAARVISLTNSKDASLDSIAKAIRNDHAIALKIIRVANSTAFSRNDPVSTLNDAVLRIGVQQIRQTVMNIEIMENFSNCSTEFIDPRLFWEHSIAVGMCSALISRETRDLDPDEAFTIGLLHDVGRMILSQAYESSYIDALRTARKHQFPVEQVERRKFLVDHASIMNNVLHKWGVSKDLVEPIVNHHLSVGNIRQTCPKRLTAVATVALADRLAHCMNLGCSGNQTVYPTEEYFEALALPKGFINTIEAKLPEMVLDMRIAMLGDLGVADYPSCRKVCTNGKLYPIYLTPDPSNDGIRFWIEGLRGEQDPSETPNLAVVRLRNAREAVNIETQLRNLEQQYNSGPLPTIVLSNGGKLKLPESAQVKRNMHLLATPFTIDEFEQAVLALNLIGESSVAQHIAA